MLLIQVSSADIESICTIDVLKIFKKALQFALMVLKGDIELTRKNRYFWILFLSGIIFLGCFLIVLKKGHNQDVLEEELTTIDFQQQSTPNSVVKEETIATENQEQTQQNTLVSLDKSTEAKENTMSITQEQDESETMFNDVQAEFYYTALTEELKEYITGKSYPDTTEPIQISYDALAYVHILHYDFAGQVQEGELICNQAIAQDLVDIFYALYEHQYAIEKVRLIDEYNADDELSMADNNTSCFNYRTVPGRTKLSNHSYGYAIDINPLYNPYVRTKNGIEQISPENGIVYADRNVDFPHKIDKEDLCYKLFVEHGFQWGGAWNSSKDYQHFEKTKNN